MWVTERADRRIGWYRLPKPAALVVLTGIRMRLRRSNLVDPQATPVAWGPEPLPQGERPLTRTVTGESNDLNEVAMGSAGEIFGRNVRLDGTSPQNIVDPNPRTISEELLARKAFIPATSLSLLAASWLQFEVHDWLSHGFNEPDEQFEIDLAPDDPWTHERPMLVERSKQGPPTTDGGKPTYRNTETHWWDASQVYGSTEFVQDMLRSREGGKLRLTPNDLLPFNPATFPLDHEVNLAGVAGNWWVGLAMLHTLFMREHNSICDRLAKTYPTWTDDEFFDHARLINAAQIAKIHTVEWTPALLSNPTLQTAMHANWFGLAGPKIKKLLGETNLGEEISGIPGSKTFDHGVPYAITEEFIAVYRMHPLIPDEYNFRRATDNSAVQTMGFDKLVGAQVDTRLDELSMTDLFYTFGTSHPGAIVLHNYPNFLREFARPDGVTIDLATYDIVKCRERGVPRYNDFRRAFHMAPAKRFEDMSNDPAIVADLKRVYQTPDDVDVMVGLFAEAPPPGFAFSDTAFRVFALMASRRLKSDRFYTYDYRPEVYTAEGMQWIDDASMAGILKRHYPELEPALEGIRNAFTPWNVTTPEVTSVEKLAVVEGPLSWRIRRGFWNKFVTFKFRHQEPSVIPVPVKDGKAVKLIPIASAEKNIDIQGIVVGKRVPRDEAQPLKQAFTRFQGKLTRWYSPMQSGLPPVSADATAALTGAYTASHHTCFAAPERTSSDLSELAVASPYASYLFAPRTGGYRWDLSFLSEFEVHAGLEKLGVVVDFKTNSSTARLEATSIETPHGTVVPGDAGWDTAARMALCSITTHTSLVRHFNWIHLTLGGPLAAITRNCLPAVHPIRRLLWPHIFGTQYSNDIITPLLLGKGGEFENVFSFTHIGLFQLFEATTGDFNLALINPLLDASFRGIAESGLHLPAQENRAALYRVFLAHTNRYLAVSYPSDDELVNDQALGQWIDTLDAQLPNGVRPVLGAETTRAGVASLLATIVYFASVEHEVTGSGVWDYQLWNDTSPVRMRTDGDRVPLDTYQRLINANFNLNVHRTMLLDDFSGLGLNAHGAETFRQFRRDLNDLQLDLDRSMPTPWRMEPKRLKANINA